MRERSDNRMALLTAAGRAGIYVTDLDVDEMAKEFPE
jgi:hypothetical protein